jgi:serine/threonine protein kinase
MSLCINLNCKSSNPDNTLFCQKCDSELLIAGRYQVTQLLSDDTGFAYIYEVMHQNVPKVMKVLKQHDPKAEELFEREFQVLQQSNHPGIPKAEDFFLFAPKDSQTILHCLVMEKIEGIDLDKYIKHTGNPIGEKCAWEWLVQLANILKEIHAKQLLHRDIKPSNIILRPSGQLVLIDFGAVKLTTNIQGKGQGTCIYTEGYGAPEQKQGDPVFQSDFFSVGRTFVYLLTGIEPGQLINPGDPHQLNWRDRTSNLSPELVGFIDRLMEQSVEKRPSNPQSMLSGLKTIHVDPLPPDSPNGDTVNPQPPPLPPSQRKPWKFLVPAIAALLLGGAIWGITTGSKNNPPPPINSEVPPPPPPPLTPVPTSKCSASNLVKKSGNLYGAIEVGSKGIKANVLQELEKPDENGFTLIARKEKIQDRNTTPIKPTTQAESVEAVEAVFRELQEKFQIPCEQIVIYGSSGFAKAPHKDAFVKAVQEKTGRAMQLISSKEEAIFVFESIVPESIRDRVFAIDIGSGNIKGAYLENPYSKTEKHITFEIPLGTGVLTDKIYEILKGGKDFAAAAENAKRYLLIPFIRETIQVRPGMQTLPRVYLAGGIPWALFTLVRPCQVQESFKTKEERVALYGTIYVEDINTFHINALQKQKTLFNPDLSQCTPERRQEVQEEIKKIKTTFTEDNLIAGAEILSALSEELLFSQKDAIFFARGAKDGLPIGYLKYQLKIAAKGGAK